MRPQPSSTQFWQLIDDVDYFQAWHWCQTRIHESIMVNPWRQMLIPPGGISQDVKYVSWYLCRATLNGFTYRNSQWDGDSLQRPPDFTLRKDVTDTKRQTTEAAIFSLWNMKAVWDKRKMFCLLERKILSFNTSVLCFEISLFLLVRGRLSDEGCN